MEVNSRTLLLLRSRRESNLDLWTTSQQSQLTLRAIAECAGIVPETPWNELVDEVCNPTPAHSSLTPEMKSEGI